MNSALGPHEALRLFTIDAAYILGMEDIIGSVTVGKYADLAVLREDPLSVPAERLKDMGTLMTLSGGEIVYDGHSQAR